MEKPICDSQTWQPISTAPRDGSEYLAYNGKQYCICHWSDMKWANPEAQPMVFPMNDATHWMPLPSPPKGKTP